MKKAILFGLVAFLLAACSDKEVSDKEIEQVDVPAKNTEETEKVESEASNKKAFDLGIADSENIKATLISAETIIDKEWDEEKIEIMFEVENKRQDTIEVQAREVSADGKMIDDTMLSMSQEIAPGKKADAILTIQNYEGDLPEIAENLEMILHVFSWDDMDYEEEHQVKIDFK